MCRHLVLLEAVEQGNNPQGLPPAPVGAEGVHRKGTAAEPGRKGRRAEGEARGEGGGGADGVQEQHLRGGSVGVRAGPRVSVGVRVSVRCTDTRQGQANRSNTIALLPRGKVLCNAQTMILSFPHHAEVEDLVETVFDHLRVRYGCLPVQRAGRDILHFCVGTLEILSR